MVLADQHGVSKDYLYYGAAGIALLSVTSGIAVFCFRYYEDLFANCICFICACSVFYSIVGGLIITIGAATMAEEYDTTGLIVCGSLIVILLAFVLHV